MFFMAVNFYCAFCKNTTDKTFFKLNKAGYTLPYGIIIYTTLAGLFTFLMGILAMRAT